MERQQELVCDLLNGAISNNVERTLTQISRSHHYLTMNISEMVRDSLLIWTYTSHTQECHFERTTLRLLVINFVVVSRHQQTPPLTSDSSKLPWSVAAECIALAARTITRWSQILAQNRDFCLPQLHPTPPLGGGGCSRRNIAMTFGMEKLE